MASTLELKAENAKLRKRIEKLEAELESAKAGVFDIKSITGIFNNSEIGIVIHNFKEILYVNDALLKKFDNLDRNVLLGKNPLSFVEKKYRKIVEQRFEELKKGKPVKAIEEAYITPTGKNVEVIVASYPIVFEGEQAAVLTVDDITSQKKVKAENELLLNVMENVPVSIIITDKNLKIEYVNDYFLKITGFSKNDVLGKTPSSLSQQKFSKELIQNIYTKTSKGQVWNGVLVNRKKNGEVYWDEVRVKAIFDENGNITNYFSVHTDITEKLRLTEELKMANETLEVKVKQRTEELEAKTKSLMRMQKALTYVVEDVNNIRANLEKANKQLEESNKNLQSFTYTVSHDLKNPIINIRDLAEFFRAKFGNKVDDEGKKMLEDIKTSSEKVVDLITHLLKFARTGIEKPDIVIIEMEPLVKSIFSEVKNNLNLQNAKLVTKTLHPFEADYPLIKQVVANLISNALKFSAGKQVPTLTVDSKLENDNVVYTFSDNGIGFDHTVKDKIFGIFFRATQAKNYTGTGIGLAIVKKIINKHGGTITAEGKPGEGATFTFTLPLKSNIKV